MNCTGCSPKAKVPKGKKKLPPGSKLKKPFTLEDLVKDYLEEVGYFGKNNTLHEQHELYLDSLTDMTEWICGMENENKIPAGPPYNVDVHQRFLRMKGNQHLINDIPGKLQDLSKQKFQVFEDIYDYVKGCKIKGFGPTAYYDFSLRYGWHLNPRITPVGKIYVHSKPGLSAMVLREKGYIDADIINPMNREDFPDEIKNSKMDAAEIEHFLCVYYKYIKQLQNKK